ncbi:MAG TPA: type I methionyl aminopeptidase [Patescibacteria group bacterium]|jgi:methionyl aminopeptidase|nr:type I methionyl aminopeptidase [Patescibacteria group bacterium]
MGISIKRPKDVAKMREAGRLVAESFAILEESIKPGVTLIELDEKIERYLKRRGAKPLYKGYEGSSASHPPFPGVICASINHEICHGIPDERVLKEGDIVGIDIGLRYRGWCGDACVTFPIGQVSPEAERLMTITRQCLSLGIEAAQPGNYLNQVGAVIEDFADRQGVTVVREWGGHGIGRELHEAPSVSHIRQPDPGPKLRPGMVFTIEPMINAGAHEWITLEDGWTVITGDGSLSAQYEHTVAITDNGPEILTKL